MRTREGDALAGQMSRCGHEASKIGSLARVPPRVTSHTSTVLDSYAHRGRTDRPYSARGPGLQAGVTGVASRR